MAEFKDRFKEALETSGLSYGQLEKTTGISKSALQRYATGETKKIPAPFIKPLAAALHVDATWLAGFDDENALPVLAEGNSLLTSRLQMFRTRMNFSKKALAQALGLKYTTYTNYEYGQREPGIRTLIKIADFYHITVDDLIGHIPQIDDPSMTKRKETTMEKDNIQKEREALLAALALIRETCRSHTKDCVFLPAAHGQELQAVGVHGPAQMGACERPGKQVAGIFVRCRDDKHTKRA